jgi:hypothetical protein
MACLLQSLLAEDLAPTSTRTAPNSTHPVLTTGPRVGSEGPVLQASKQVERAMPQAEHGLWARTPAGCQALRAGVHTAIEQDAARRGEATMTHRHPPAPPA